MRDTTLMPIPAPAPPGYPLGLPFTDSIRVPHLWPQPMRSFKVVGIVILDVANPSLTNPYSSYDIMQTLRTVIHAFNISSWGMIRDDFQILVHRMTLDEYTHVSIPEDASTIAQYAYTSLQNAHPNTEFYMCGVINPILSSNVLGWGYLGVRTYYTIDRPTRALFMIYGQQHWTVFAHEIGHLFGLGHAGSSVDTTYNEYLSDDIMGYKYSSTHDDFDPHSSDFNIVSRFQLGWVSEERRAYCPGQSVVKMATLGGNLPTTHVVGMSILCRFCKPFDDTLEINGYGEVHYGGQLFLSYRTVESQDLQHITNIFGEYVTLRYHVHVHFYTGKHHDDAYEARKSEFWDALPLNGSFVVPGSNSAYGLYIYVCAMTCTQMQCPEVIRSDAPLDTATVVVSNVSVDDAIRQCLYYRVYCKVSVIVGNRVSYGGASSSNSSPLTCIVPDTSGVRGWSGTCVGIIFTKRFFMLLFIFLLKWYMPMEASMDVAMSNSGDVDCVRRQYFL